MNFILSIFDFIIHIDTHLITLIQTYGSFIYPILFFIIFGETGRVITPFLPGISLFLTLGIAALLGNTVNYFIGRHFGHKILSNNNKFLKKIIKKEYIDKTHSFFERHGGKAIILSRLFPILRTFAPFIAGIGEMSLIRYTIYNVIGGVSWVALLLGLGYSFGTIPFIKEHFSLIVFGIIGISLLPAIYAVINSKFKSNQTITEKI